MKLRYWHVAVVVLSLLVFGRQPAVGARYIPGDLSIGTWDDISRTYTLTTDVYETIEVEEDNLTLDGAGHTVMAGSSLDGICLLSRTGVIVRNVNVEG